MTGSRIATLFRDKLVTIKVHRRYLPIAVSLPHQQVPTRTSFPHKDQPSHSVSATFTISFPFSQRRILLVFLKSFSILFKHPFSPTPSKPLIFALHQSATESHSANG